MKVGSAALFGMILIAGLMVTAPAAADEAKAAEKPLLSAGDVAPRFGPMKLHNAELADMRSFTLSKFVGAQPETPAKAVLVSFFATWCAPCKKELPFLAKLDRTYRDQGLQVVTISIDKEKEALEEVSALVKKHDIRFPVLSDRFNFLARRYLGAKTALPSLFLLRADGTIELVKQGYDGDASAFLTAEVKKLLGV